MLGIIPTLARWVKVEEVLKSLRAKRCYGQMQHG